ncbi:substrate-binding domain-containing protein [Candidatus Poribacteria bacterium]|nr:substrate-binding domain-containing protein [Candidatus Poribacteria bacterium]
MKRLIVLFVTLVSILFISQQGLAEQRLRLATTTSTENTGLLAMFLPPFEQKYGIKVDVIAVGTGKALKLGENGDVDVVLAHARSAEDEFIQKGFGVNRRDVMYNDFVIVGPKTDPAGISKVKNVDDAFKLIAQKEAIFVSRGDESGTHIKEKDVWKAAGIKPTGKWYVEAGQGMEAVLVMADEKNAYTLTDRATWLAHSEKFDLGILLQGDPALFNPYGIIAVNPARYPSANYMGAMLLIAWFTSPEGQKMIGDFKKNGQMLFVPVAVPTEGPKGKTKD